LTVREASELVTSWVTRLTTSAAASLRISSSTRINFLPAARFFLGITLTIHCHNG
jgi:hypothetical protein